MPKAASSATRCSDGVSRLLAAGRRWRGPARRGHGRPTAGRAETTRRCPGLLLQSRPRQLLPAPTPLYLPERQRVRARSNSVGSRSCTSIARPATSLPSRGHRGRPAACFCHARRPPSSTRDPAARRCSLADPPGWPPRPADPLRPVLPPSGANGAAVGSPYPMAAAAAASGPKGQTGQKPLSPRQTINLRYRSLRKWLPARSGSVPFFGSGSV